MKWLPMRLPGDALTSLMLAGTGFRADMVAVFSCEVGSDFLNGVIEVAGEFWYGEA